MPEESRLHIRENPETGRGQIVNCPYEWIPLKRPDYEGYSLQINQLGIVNQAIGLDAISCIGSCCAIYPCERVRDFVEGKI